MKELVRDIRAAAIEIASRHGLSKAQENRLIYEICTGIADMPMGDTDPGEPPPDQL